jgi:hypothetical protein
MDPKSIIQIDIKRVYQSSMGCNSEKSNLKSKDMINSDLEVNLKTLK